MKRLLALTLLAACGPPEVPAEPTWADVEPILRGQCSHCHGASAGDRVRFDFYDLDPVLCGAAAEAMDAPPMAHGLAALIAAAITPPEDGGRPRMPPLPAPGLADWERDTILRWSQSPTRGVSVGNQLPRATIVGELASTFDDRIEMTVVVDDPDGESVVGLLQIGDERLKLTGPGSYRVSVDSTAWPTARYSAQVSVCDGWEQACYALPEMVVVHRRRPRAMSARPAARASSPPSKVHR